MMNLFILMTAYYIIKPIRESLILGEAGPELKSYAGALGALAFLLLVPLYGRLASRLTRIRLINGVTAFFAANLVIFYILAQFKIAFDITFFLWAGLFNLMLVAQFWAFTNDVYTLEQGKRLFAIVGIGSSAGAIFGAAVASRLFVLLGAYSMMLVAAGLLVVCMGLTNWIHNREDHPVCSALPDEPLKSNGAFQLVFKNRYLYLIAALILLANTVNTTGEFILAKSVTERAQTVAAVSGNDGMSKEDYIGKFYADFYFWVNLVSAGIQLFAVSRIMKYIGVGPALFLLPLVSFGGYTALSFAPMLTVIRAAKIAENGTDYSIQNTARHALFLRTSREAKYKGKTAIDGFFWRLGDAFSAAIVFVGTTFAFSVRGFARTNAILTAAWLGVAAAIVWLRFVHGEPEGEETGPLLNDSSNANA
jgi:AAA family ATP:ADP antiporter